ncbi:MAG: NADPH-dependent F420 reductase [Actinomycetota bacterium]
MDIAVIGGTGAEGFGLSLRLAAAGHRVVIGSRDAGRGAAAAEKAAGALGEQARVDGAANTDAAGSAEVVAVTVPFVGQADLYRSIKDVVRPGGVVIDATSPLATAVGGRAWQVLRPWHGSAAEQAAAILGDRVRVVAAFHTIAAGALTDLDHPVDSDVFVCGDDPEAKGVAGALIEQIPDLRWVDVGTLSMARIAESLTALLVSVNRTYKVRGAGFRVTGRPSWGAPGPAAGGGGSAPDRSGGAPEAPPGS